MDDNSSGIFRIMDEGSLSAYQAAPASENDKASSSVSNVVTVALRNVINLGNTTLLILPRGTARTILSPSGLRADPLALRS